MAKPKKKFRIVVKQPKKVWLRKRRSTNGILTLFLSFNLYLALNTHNWVRMTLVLISSALIITILAVSNFAPVYFEEDR